MAQECHPIDQSTPVSWPYTLQRVSVVVLSSHEPILGGLEKHVNAATGNFIFYDPDSEGYGTPGNVWTQEGSHPFVPMSLCSCLSLSLQILWDAWELRHWELLPLHVSLANIWESQLCSCQLQFSEIADGAVCRPQAHSGVNGEIAFGEIFIPKDFSCPCVFLLLKCDLSVASISWVTSTALAVVWLVEVQNTGTWLIGGTKWAHKQSLLGKNDWLAILRQMFAAPFKVILYTLEDASVMSSDSPLVFVFNIEEKHRLNWLTR